MKISREELVELLVQKTGFRQERIEEQLNQLISEIHEATDKGERYTIPRLGSFVVANDQLQFVPAETLRTEVNHKYAGMQPIELISTYDKSEEEELPAVPPEEDSDSKSPDAPMVMRQEQVDEDIWPAEEDIWGWDGDEAQEEEPEPQSASAEEEEYPADAGEKQATPAEEQEEKDIKEPPPEEPVVEEEPAEEPAPATVTEPSAESPLTAKKENRRRQKKKTSSLPLVLVAAAMVILIAVSTWFLYEMGIGTDQGATDSPVAEENVGQTQGQTTQPQPPQNDEAAEDTERDPPAGQSEGGAGDPNSEPSGQNTVADTKASSDTPVYGLKGSLNSEANDGYTIVILSMRDRQSAKDIFDKMNQKGYRTLMVSAIVSGEKFWRVAVGQFETIPGAQKNAKKLPEPYNDNFFIKRIL